MKPNMRTALVTGITGQDGLYLTELLLSKGYHVIGVVRNCEDPKTLLPTARVENVELIVWNMLDQCQITEAIAKHRPAEIYNLAAYSSGAGMFNEAVDIGEVNGLAVARILDAIRSVDSSIRFCQASSSEMFGNALESPQTETTTFQPRTPYGAAKLYAHSMIQIYRQHYRLYACSAILFNHESPRRGLGFVTRKVTYEAAKIKLGLSNKLCLGNLDARRDWGFAGDYVHAMWLMLQHPHADDYIVATGKTFSVRELCEFAFSYLDLDYRDYVYEDSASYRPIESVQLVGNSTKIRNQLGWLPEMEFHELISMMVDADLRNLIEQERAKG